MALKYTKLFDLLERRGMRKVDLLIMSGISSTTLTKLSNNETVADNIILRICNTLNCQPDDIVEYLPNEKEPSE